MKQSFNRLSLLASAIAGIVGSGWLLGPLACAKIAGPAAIICWILGGFLISIIAATFVLLTRALPIAGGTARFFQLSYGHFAGFGFSWIAWIAWLAVPPIETMALLQYSSTYLPQLMTHGPNPQLTSLGITVAVILLCVITIINSAGAKIYSRCNYFITFFKLAIPIATAIILLSQHFSISNFQIGNNFMPYGIQSLLAALPIAGVIYSFIGFNPAIQLASESVNPKRDIPIAVFGALIICVLLYTLIQIAFIGALPVSALQSGWKHLHYAGDIGPFVGLLSIFGIFWLVKIIYAGATISPFGTAMVQSMATARLTIAMSQNRYLPNFLQKRNAKGTPLYAILINLLIGSLFFLPFPSWQKMVGFLVSCLILGYVVGPMSLLVLSRTHHERFPKIHTSWINILCVSAFYVCNMMIYWTGWHTVFKIFILFAIGYSLISIKALVQKNYWKSLDIKKGYWVLFYISGLTMISYLGSFGGQKIIAFGTDFIVIAIFSVMIYAFAYYSALKTVPSTEPKPIALPN